MTELVLDPAIRDWVLIPIVVIMFLMGVLRNNVTKMLKKDSPPNRTQVARLKRIRHHTLRSPLLQMILHAAAAPPPARPCLVWCCGSCYTTSHYSTRPDTVWLKCLPCELLPRHHCVGHAEQSTDARSKAPCERAVHPSVCIQFTEEVFLPKR